MAILVVCLCVCPSYSSIVKSASLLSLYMTGLLFPITEYCVKLQQVTSSGTLNTDRV